MTDNEIIKALECCISTGTALDCFKCPMAENRVCYGSNTKVSQLVVKNALSLINRQKAEIDHFRKHTKKVKANLKYYLDTNEENGVVWIPAFAIDNLVKEMTEDEGK